jgi:hypothetical protein
MKKIFFPLFILACISLVSTAQVRMPAPSPTQTIKQEFAIGSVELTYSRPSAKGRKIYGDLVPYNNIWRTGANAAVKLVLTEPLEIGGKKVDTGTYVLYTIPGVDSWEIILNKGLKNWGTDGYKEAEDVARFKVVPVKMPTQMETFTMNFSDIGPENCFLNIMWEKTRVAIPIKADFKDKVRGQIEAAMKTDKKPYWQAAQFYNEYDKDLPKAIENITKAIEGNDKAYWMWIYKAKIQKEMGDKAGALASSNKSLELAKEDKNDDYVKINVDFQKTLK